MGWVPWWAPAVMWASLFAYIAAIAVTVRRQAYLPWVRALFQAGIIAASGVFIRHARKMRFAAPVCGRHAGHWRTYTVAYALWLAATVVLLGNAWLYRDDLKNAALVNRLLAAAGVLFVVGLVVMDVLWWRRLVRAVEITATGMRLRGVSRAFVDAVEAERRRPRPAVRDDDFDEER